MAGRDAFGMVGGSGIPPPPGSVPSMRLAFSAEGTPVYQPATLPVYNTAAGDGPPQAATTAAVTQEGGNGGVVGDQGKKKHGRPRKYGPDGTMALALSPVSPPGAELAQATAQSSGLPSPTADYSGKKARGRPPGSGKKQQLAALGSAGVGFTPHIIYVNPGEDVSSKIMSFSQQGSRAICILSANGSLSNVTLRQAASSGGTLTLEGRYEILSLSGSFLLSESGGQRSRTGGLSVSVAGSDGRVIGGGVAGLLTAASHVQVIVGSFLPEGQSKVYASPEPSPAPQKLIPHRGNTGATSPPSRGTLSESSGGAGSPINPNAPAYNGNNSHGLGNVQWK